MVRTLTGLCLLCWTTLLSAGDPGASIPYVGLGYSQLRVDPDMQDVRLRPEAVTARVGMEDQYLAVEARGAMGLSTDRDREVRHELDQLLGGYVRLSWPVHERIRPYLIGGYSRVESTLTTDLEGDRSSESLSDSGFSGGAGLDIQVARDLVLNVELIQYVDSTDGRIGALNLGVRSGLSPPAMR